MDNINWTTTYAAITATSLDGDTSDHPPTGLVIAIPRTDDNEYKHAGIK